MSNSFNWQNTTIINCDTNDQLVMATKSWKTWKPCIHKQQTARIHSFGIHYSVQ